MKRLKVLGIAAAIAGGFGFASVATAAPLSPAPLGSSGGEAQIEKADFVCGPGLHVGRFGGCRPNFGPRPFYRPYGYYGPRPYYRPYGFYGPRPFF